MNDSTTERADTRTRSTTQRRSYQFDSSGLDTFAYGGILSPTPRHDSDSIYAVNAGKPTYVMHPKYAPKRTRTPASPSSVYVKSSLPPSIVDLVRGLYILSRERSTFTRVGPKTRQSARSDCRSCYALVSLDIRNGQRYCQAIPPRHYSRASCGRRRTPSLR